MKCKLTAVLMAGLLLTGCGGKVDTLETVTEQTEQAVTETTAGTTETTTTITAKTTTTVKATTTETTTTQTETTTIPEPTEDEEGGEFDVERGFFVTKLTMPISTLKSFDESYDPEQNIEKLKEENEDWLLSAEIDGDNVVYTMKTAEYNKWRRETEQDIEGNIQEVISDETNTIIDITHDDDYGNLYVYVTDEESYRKSFDSLKIMGIAVGIRIVNMFGFFAETLTIHVIDSGTGAEFFTDVYDK